MMSVQPIAQDDLPSTGDVAKGLAKFLRPRSRPLQAEEVYGPLAETFSLTGQQLSLKRHTTHESRWHNRVQSARAFLVSKELMFRLPENSWRLTDAGRTWVDRLEWIKTVSPAI